MPPIDLRSTVQAQTRDRFLGFLGSFWTEQFEDSEVVRRILQGAEGIFVQGDVDMKERLLVARQLPDAPLYHRQIWWRLVLTSDDQVVEHANAPSYDPSNPYYQGLGSSSESVSSEYEEWLYGSGEPVPVWSFRVSNDLADLKCVTNGVTKPTYLCYRGQDFFYRPGVISFKYNPLESDRFEVSGSGIALWLYMSDWDLDLLHQYYSIPTQISSKSTENYRRAVEGVWSARVRGPSWESLAKIVSGCTGVPLCVSDGEVVEWVGLNQQKLWVVTDKNAYGFPKDFTPIVSVGDSLVLSQSLVQEMRLLTSISGGYSSSSESSEESPGEHLLLGPGMFPAGLRLRNSILFPNTVTDVYSVAGVTKFKVHSDSEEEIAKWFSNADLGSYVSVGEDINPAVFVASSIGPRLIVIAGSPDKWPARKTLKNALVRLLLEVQHRVIIQDDAEVERLLGIEYATSSSASESSTSSDSVSSDSVSSDSVSSSSEDSSQEESPSSHSSTSSEAGPCEACGGEQLFNITLNRLDSSSESSSEDLEGIVDTVYYDSHVSDDAYCYWLFKASDGPYTFNLYLWYDIPTDEWVVLLQKIQGTTTIHEWYSDGSGIISCDPVTGQLFIVDDTIDIYGSPDRITVAFEYPPTSSSEAPPSSSSSSSEPSSSSDPSSEPLSSSSSSSSEPSSSSDPSSEPLSSSSSSSSEPSSSSDLSSEPLSSSSSSDLSSEPLSSSSSSDLEEGAVTLLGTPLQVLGQQLYILPEDSSSSDLSSEPLSSSSSSDLSSEPLSSSSSSDALLSSSSEEAVATYTVSVTGRVTTEADGDDGDLQYGEPWPEPRFTDNGDGTVTDHLTNLMWAKDAQALGGNAVWTTAIASCEGSSLAGHEDWRMPNINELLSLFDPETAGTSPGLPPGHPFTNVTSSVNTWSSTTVRENTGNAWKIRWDGLCGGGNKPADYVASPWPVRSAGGPVNVMSTGQTTVYAAGDDGEYQVGIQPQDPLERFTDNGDGTLTDTFTGLTWLKDASAFSTRGWASAVETCRTLASGTAGLTDGSVAGDWRLPNIRELATIYDRAGRYPVMQGLPFTNTQYYPPYWTSTYSNDAGNAYTMEGQAGPYKRSATSNFRLIAVKGGIAPADFSSSDSSEPLSSSSSSSSGEAVSITTQPSDYSTTTSGNASFSIVASGSTPITYQWEESDNGGSSWSQITGADSDTLSLSSVPLASDGYLYRCTVTNAYGTAVSNSATLTVSDCSTYPATDCGATAQGSMRFSYSPVYPMPDAGCKPRNEMLFWQFAGGSTWYWHYTGPTGSGVEHSFQLSLLSLHSSSWYLSYEIHDPDGSRYWGLNDPSGICCSITTGEILITQDLTMTPSAGNACTYNFILRTNDGPVLEITSQPTDQSVSVGSDAVFSVTADGLEEINYRWQKYNTGTESWDSLSGSTSAQLTVTNVQSSDNGNLYRCRVWNTWSALSALYSDSATLTVT